MYKIILCFAIFLLADLMIFIEVKAQRRRNGNKIDEPVSNLHMMYPPSGSGGSTEKE